MKGHHETRLSAANMTLKMGECYAALSEYQYLSLHTNDLTPKGQQVLSTKLREAERLCVGVPPPPGTEKRTITVREEVGGHHGLGGADASMEVHWAVHHVAVSSAPITIAAAFAEAEEHVCCGAHTHTHSAITTQHSRNATL